VLACVAVRVEQRSDALDELLRGRRGHAVADAHTAHVAPEQDPELAGVIRERPDARLDADFSRTSVSELERDAV